MIELTKDEVFIISAAKPHVFKCVTPQGKEFKLIEKWHFNNNDICLNFDDILNMIPNLNLDAIADNIYDCEYLIRNMFGLFGILLEVVE